MAVTTNRSFSTSLTDYEDRGETYASQARRINEQIKLQRGLQEAMMQEKLRQERAIISGTTTAGNRVWTAGPFYYTAADTGTITMTNGQGYIGGGVTITADGATYVVSGNGIVQKALPEKAPLVSPDELAALDAQIATIGRSL